MWRYSEGAMTHRLASAASLYFLAVVVSALCSVTVIEASGINDLVPETRTWLKRETLALAAQLAHLAHVEEQEMQGAGAPGGGGEVGESLVGLPLFTTSFCSQNTN